MKGEAVCVGERGGAGRGTHDVQEGPVDDRLRDVNGSLRAGGVVLS